MNTSENNSATSVEQQPQSGTPVQTTVQDIIKQDEKPVPVQKKTFTRQDVKSHVDVKIVFPALYPDYEPWAFKLRLKLSRGAEEQRQQYLALSAAEMTATLTKQALNEVCDLLVALPTGFGDLRDNGRGPGASFREYVETTTDPNVKDILAMVVEGANTVYWNAVSPREFRPKI